MAEPVTPVVATPEVPATPVVETPKPETPAPAVKEPTKDERVKALLDAREAKNRPKNGKGEPPPVDGNKPADKADAKPDEKKQEKPAEPVKNADAEHAKRISRLVAQEDRNRIANEALANQRKEFEAQVSSHKENLAQWQTFTQTFPQDPVKALANLGLKKEHLDALYWRLNDSVLNKNPGTLTEADVETRARQIAAEEFKKLNEQGAQQSQEQFNRAMTDAQNLYADKTAQVYQANKAKYPAITAMGVSKGDIHAYARAEFDSKGRTPTPDEVLAHFETERQKRIEAAGYTRQQVEAPKADKPTTATKTITADWQNGSVPAKEQKSTSQSIKDSRAEIKKKLDQGFYRRGQS